MVGVVDDEEVAATVLVATGLGNSIDEGDDKPPPLVLVPPALCLEHDIWLKPLPRSLISYWDDDV